MLCIEFETLEPDILIGILSAFPFEGFQEYATYVEAYLNDEDWERLQSEILASITGMGKYLQHKALPEVNWNAEWEASFQPVTIDDFCAIRASFHPPMPGFSHELVIDPKMAFGTGHHETTELMIRQIRHIDISGKTILDMGCGTGILAILAAKSGANKVIAVDNDPEAVDNAIENAALNNISIDVRNGETRDLHDAEYDLILANINRNTLLEIIPSLATLLTATGALVVSGFLLEDARSIKSCATTANLSFIRDQSIGEWTAITFTKHQEQVQG